MHNTKTCLLFGFIIALPGILLFAENNKVDTISSSTSTQKSLPQKTLTIGDSTFDLDRLEKQGKYEMPIIERRGMNYERRAKYFSHSKHIAFIETAMYDDNYDGTLRIYNLKGDLLLEKPETSMGFDEVAEIGSSQVAAIVNNVFVGGGHLDIYNISDSEVVFSTPCEMGKCNLETSPSGNYIVFTRRDFESNHIEYYTYDLNGLKQIATGTNLYCVFTPRSGKNYLLVKSQVTGTQNPSDNERPKVDISYYSNYKKQWATTMKSQWLNASFSRSEKYVIVELVNDRVIKDNRLISQDVAFSIIDTSKGTTITEGKISPETVEKYKQETIE